MLSSSLMSVRPFLAHVLTGVRASLSANRAKDRSFQAVSEHRL
jgi:hypothetical protein